MPKLEPASAGDPPTWQTYAKWLHETCELDLRTEKSRYESISSKIMVDASESPFWTNLRSELRESDDAYYARTGYKLFATAAPAELVRKSWDSVLEKSFRKNVLTNASWPSAPPRGWCLPKSWLTGIADLVRTMVVVKYLDGVECVVGTVKRVAESSDLPFRVDMEAKDEGYYAAHCYVTMELSLPTELWVNETVPVDLEIQVTTQLQEVIRRLTHIDYERRRTEVRPQGLPWQWDYSGRDFVPNYLGHILHYVEGMIMDVRQRTDDRK